jgi:hypothetical protein
LEEVQAAVRILASPFFLNPIMEAMEVVVPSSTMGECGRRAVGEPWPQMCSNPEGTEDPRLGYRQMWAARVR